MSAFTTFANSTLLKPTKWVADTLFVAPGGHRLRNAFGLSAGLYVGDKFTNLITGQKFSGEKISKDDYPAILQPLYGIMEYNRFSDEPSDRWKFITRGLITAGFGAAGAMLGSYDYFLTKSPSIKEQLKNPWHHSKYGLTDANIQDFFTANHSTVATAAEKAVAAGKLTDEITGKIQKWLNFASPHNMDKHVYDEISKAYLLPAGLAAIPGSALGSNATPLPLYPWLLGERFRNGMLGYKVAMPFVGKFWSNSAIPDKFSLNFLVDEIAQKIGDPRNLDLGNKTVLANLEKRVGDALKGAIEPIYKDLTSEQVASMRAEVMKASEDAMKRLQGLSKEEASKVIEGESKAVKESLTKMLQGTGLNEFMHRNGVDLTKVHFEDHGVSGWLAKLMGADLKQYTYEYQRSLKAQGLPNCFETMVAPTKMSRPVAYARQTAVVVGSAAAMGGITTGAIKLFSNSHTPSAAASNISGTLVDGVSVSQSNISPSSTEGSDRKHIVHTPVHEDFISKTKSLLNGPFLNLSEAAVETFNVPPSGHRLMCAAGLTAFMMIGDKLMQAITHRQINGNLITKDKIHPVLHTLFDKNLMLYNGRHSMEYKDQWAQVLRMFVPSITGIFGVMLGSNMFFAKKKEKVKSAKYLDEYDQKAAFAQSGPWTWLAGIASLPSASMGVSLFPIPINYGTALGGRFSLANDRAVMFPGIAEWWSNNHSAYPMQPAALLKRMAAYGAYNPAKELKQLDEMIPGVLKHWYDNVTQKQIDDFTHAFENYRLEGLKKGLRGKELEKNLLKHITGQGLEETLEMIGMDPAKAILGNNGMSGRIGNALGAKNKVVEMQLEYVNAYHQRKQKRLEEKMRDMSPANSNEPGTDYSPDVLPESIPTLPTSSSSRMPAGINTSRKWQENVAKTALSTPRAEPKPISEIAARKPAASHTEKAEESKGQPPVGLTA